MYGLRPEASPGAVRGDFGRAGTVVCADSTVGVFQERGHSMPPLGTDLVSALNPVPARR